MFEVLHRHTRRGDTLYCSVRFWPSQFSSIVTAALSSVYAHTDDDDVVHSSIILRMPAAVTSWLHSGGVACRKALQQSTDEVAC